MTTQKLTDIDVILRDISEARDFMAKHADEKVAPLAEEVTRVSKSLQTVEASLKDLRMERAARCDDGRLRVPTGKFAGFDLLDLALARNIYEYRSRRVPAAIAVLEGIKAQQKALSKLMTPDTILAWEDGAIKRRGIVHPHNNMGQAMFKDAAQQWRAGLMQAVTKASLDSSTAAAGDELVPTFEAAELWMDVNLETLVLPLMMQSPMPTNPFQIPIQFGDTNWYPITENVQVTTTAPATQRVTLTAYGLKTGVPFSDELEEDSIVALIPELRRSLARNAAEVIDDVLLNGDTTTANGINSDGATITTSTAGKAQWLLGFDGLIHQAIVDNSSNQSIDKNAAVDADIYNRTLAKLGRYAVPRRRGEVVFITDVNTATRSLSITEMETVDVAGVRATLSTGELLNMYGKPVVQSEQMRLADVDGKVTDAGNTTNTGRILAVNTTQWRVGFRRQIEMETEREAGKGQTTMYVSFRIALTERTGTRSSATHTAIAYDITGVA